MIELRDKELLKLGELLDIPFTDLKKLHSANLLHSSRVIDELVHSDYIKIKRTNQYTGKQIRNAIMAEYQISEYKAAQGIHAKRKRTLHLH